MPGNGQQRFLGMLKNIHSGKVSVKDASPALLAAAGRYVPRDPSEVQVKSSAVRFQVALQIPFLAKQANLEGAISRVRKAVQSAGNARRDTLAQHTDKLKKERENFKKELDKARKETSDAKLEAQQHQFDAQNAQQEAEEARQQAEAAANAAANPAMPAGPVPPPSQPPYGAMLTGQPDPNQQQQAQQ